LCVRRQQRKILSRNPHHGHTTTASHVRRPCTHARNQECVLAEVHQSPGAPRPSGGVPLADSLTRATKRGKSSSLKRQVTTSIHSSPALVSATRVRSVFGHNVEREGSPALQAAPALSSGKLWLVRAAGTKIVFFCPVQKRPCDWSVCVCFVHLPAGQGQPSAALLRLTHVLERVHVGALSHTTPLACLQDSTSPLLLARSCALKCESC
jgi:hypothetical protein